MPFASCARQFAQSINTKWRRNNGGFAFDLIASSNQEEAMSNPRHPSRPHSFDRTRNEIQATWTTEERILRQQVAFERQQALWRMLATAAASGQASNCEAALPAA